MLSLDPSSGPAGCIQVCMSHAGYIFSLIRAWESKRMSLLIELDMNGITISSLYVT